MKMKFMGITDAKKHIPKEMEPSDLSDKHYECITMGLDERDNMVAILHSKETAPLKWKVAYGMSQIYFRTFEEAMDFCNSRGMEIIKGRR